MTCCPTFGTALCAVGATTPDPKPGPLFVLAVTPVQLGSALAAEVTHSDPNPGPSPISGHSPAETD